MTSGDTSTSKVASAGTRKRKQAKTAASPRGDYHEFFKIQNIAQQPEVVESRLIF